MERRARPPILNQWNRTHSTSPRWTVVPRDGIASLYRRRAARFLRSHLGDTGDLPIQSFRLAVGESSGVRRSIRTVCDSKAHEIHNHLVRVALQLLRLALDRSALHVRDGSRRSLFERTQRTFRHGCIRVSEPRDLVLVGDLCAERELPGESDRVAGTTRDSPSLHHARACAAHGSSESARRCLTRRHHR